MLGPSGLGCAYIGEGEEEGKEEGWVVDCVGGDDCVDGGGADGGPDA